MSAVQKKTACPVYLLMDCFWPASAVLHATRTCQPITTPPSAQLFQALRRLRCRGGEQCCLALYAPEEAGQYAGSWSVDSSVLPSSVAWHGCHKATHQNQLIPPSWPQCARPRRNLLAGRGARSPCVAAPKVELTSVLDLSMPEHVYSISLCHSALGRGCALLSCSCVARSSVNASWQP